MKLKEKKGPPPLLSLHTSAILSQLCMGLPDKGHYQGVFGVLLETAGPGTHVYDTLSSPC